MPLCQYKIVPVEVIGIKKEVIIWRIIAVICTLVWTIVFFAFNAFTQKTPSTHIITLFHNNILYGLSIAISIILMFFPMQFYLYAVKCLAWGLIVLIDQRSVSAVLMYLLGCAFVYRQGFFAKRTYIKCFILLVPLVVVTAFQYRLGEDVLVASLMNLFFLAMFFALLYVLLIHPLVEKSKAPPDGSIILADCKLSKEEFALLDAFLLKEYTYKEIGYAIKISESNVKQRMKSLLEKIKADNRGNLLSMHKNGKVIFPN